jgi:F-type H+-transporting ATPase subunit a
MLWVFLGIASSYKKRPLSAPKGKQSFFEPIILYIRDDVAKSAIGPKHEKFLPYLLTIFFFIWFNNLLGLLPGGANLTGNIAITLSLAVITFLITLFNGNKYYWGHIFNPPGVPLVLKPIIVPIEIVGVFTKPFSLMVRLFANITAGHIIILSLLGLIFIFKTPAASLISIPFALFMSFLELFVAILQAYIFTLLSAMYFGAAVEEHADHDHGIGYDEASHPAGH